MAGPQRVAIGLGSNLGNREELIQRAVDLLCESCISDPRLSSLLETAAIGCEPDAPDFLNAVLIGRADISPATLLSQCHEIEQLLGRQVLRQRSPGSYSSRTIDIDVLIIGDMVEPQGPPILPHPRIREREFVLRPFSEVAPDWPLPPDGVTVRACLEALTAGD